jgi:hypothetical protein
MMTSEKNEVSRNLTELESALCLLVDEQFKQLNFTGRLAILVPSDSHFDLYKDNILDILHKFNMTTMTSNESMEILHNNHDHSHCTTSSREHRVIFDTIDRFDGLESLVVIGLDFDQPYVDNKGRSACHRLITRAQMCLIIVGGVSDNGYFEWLRNVRYNATTGHESIVDPTAPRKIVKLGIEMIHATEREKPPTISDKFASDNTFHDGNSMKKDKEEIGRTNNVSSSNHSNITLSSSVDVKVDSNHFSVDDEKETSTWDTSASKLIKSKSKPLFDPVNANSQSQHFFNPLTKVQTI